MQNPIPQDYRTDLNELDMKKLRADLRISEVAARSASLIYSQGQMRGICPFHSEITPSLVVDDTSGTYLCTGCGARGDVLRLGQALTEAGFLETCEWLIRHHTKCSPHQHDAIRQAAGARLTAVNTARRWWRQARPLRGSPVDSMVQRMGFPSTRTGCLRFDWVTELDYDDEPGQVCPSLVLAFQDVDGSIVGIARYLLNDDCTVQQEGKPRRMGQFSGATARFGPPRSRIILVHDIGDVPMITRLYPGEPVWAVLEAELLHEVVLPDCVTHVTVIWPPDDAGAAAKAAVRTSLASQCLTVDVHRLGDG